MTLPKVLFVDDEPNVLLGVARSLRNRVQVLTACSGADGLQQLSAGDIDVVVSDMRMPEMDGAVFLARARALVPDTVRLVMSGHADLEASVRAINEGNVFRFLIKPVPRDVLGEVLMSAVEQRRLVLAERELLERTLTGAVDALSETLALTSPLAFGRSRRLRHLVAALAGELRLPRKWALEVAAMLSQLGAATLPPDTLRRWYDGEALSEAELEMVRGLNALSCQLLAHIPRLEPVQELIAALDDRQAALEASLPVRAFVVADALERRLWRGETLEQALDALSTLGRYDALMLDACRPLRGLLTGFEGEEREVAVSGVHPGMTLLDDVHSRSGALLIARGHIVTEGVMICLRNFAATVGVRDPLRVSVPIDLPRPALSVVR